MPRRTDGKKTPHIFKIEGRWDYVSSHFWLDNDAAYFFCRWKNGESDIYIRPSLFDKSARKR